MKKFSFGLLALLLATVFSSLAQAASFSIIGDTGLLSPGVTSGSLQIQYDPSPEGYDFDNGGVRLELLSSVPGIVTFTNAEVPNGGRWTAASALSVAADRAELEGFSILTEGLPTDAPSIFATVNYTVVPGALGATTLSLAGSGADPLADGDFDLATVAANVSFEGATISTVPEPATLAMAGMSLIGLVLRRRNG